MSNVKPRFDEPLAFRREDWMRSLCMGLERSTYADVLTKPPPKSHLELREGCKKRRGHHNQKAGFSGLDPAPVPLRLARCSSKGKRRGCRVVACERSRLTKLCYGALLRPDIHLRCWKSSRYRTPLFLMYEALLHPMPGHLGAPSNSQRADIGFLWISPRRVGH